MNRFLFASAFLLLAHPIKAQEAPVRPAPAALAAPDAFDLSAADAMASGSLQASQPFGTDTSAPTIAFQGVLSDGGAPVSDDSYTVSIGLFDAATGGTAQYAETHSVMTQDGAFGLAIGGGTGTSGSFDTVTFADETWVEVAVGGTNLGPRTLLMAVPHARSFTAGAEVSGAVPGAAALWVENTSPSGSSIGLVGRSASTSGFGVFGDATTTTGSSIGVFGRNASSGGIGVFGYATRTFGTTIGVFGQSLSSSGWGVWGNALASEGPTYGVLGRSSSFGGNGVRGEAISTTGGAVGVYGQSVSTAGRGVVGISLASSGATYGVIAQSNSTEGEGMRATAGAPTGATIGVRASVNSPDGYGGYFTGGRGLYVETSISTDLFRALSLSTTRFLIRGDGRVGIGSEAPLADLHVANEDLALQASALVNEALVVEAGDAVIGVYSDAAGTWGSALALGEVNSAGTIASKWGIARRTGATGGLYFTFGTSNNYGSNDAQMRIDTDGSVHADGAFTGGGADFAEYFPLAGGASVQPGDVVGVTAGRAGLATDGADQVMVVSSNPAFVGNADAADGGALIALVGQAVVNVIGGAAPGDMLVASGRADGRARAISAEAYVLSHGPVLGRVLTADGNSVVALVGVDEAAALRAVVQRQQAELDALRGEVQAIRESLAPRASR